MNPGIVFLWTFFIVISAVIIAGGVLVVAAIIHTIKEKWKA